MGSSDKDFTDEQALIEALGSKDATLRDRSWGYLNERYGEKIRRSLIARGATVEQAQDCVQDAFTQAIKGIRTFERRSKVKTWLWTIAAHNWISLIRKQRRTPKTVPISGPADDETPHAVDPPDPGPDPERQAQTVMFFDCIDSALANFSRDYPEYAKVIRALIAGQPVSEIERFAGKKSGTVREDLRNIRDRFREYSAVCRDASVRE